VENGIRMGLDVPFMYTWRKDNPEYKRFTTSIEYKNALDHGALLRDIDFENKHKYEEKSVIRLAIIEQFQDTDEIVQMLVSHKAPISNHAQVDMSWLSLDTAYELYLAGWRHINRAYRIHEQAGMMHRINMRTCEFLLSIGAVSQPEDIKSIAISMCIGEIKYDSGVFKHIVSRAMCQGYASECLKLVFKNECKSDDDKQVIQRIAASTRLNSNYLNIINPAKNNDVALAIFFEYADTYNYWDPTYSTVCTWRVAERGQCLTLDVLYRKITKCRRRVSAKLPYTFFRSLTHYHIAKKHQLDIPDNIEAHYRQYVLSLNRKVPTVIAHKILSMC
jgi:hypothetical protein